MKHLFFYISMLFCLSSTANAGNTIPLNHQSNTSTQGGSTKNPVQSWNIIQEGYVLTMSATSCDYILSLYDEDNVLVYFVFVPMGTTQIVLPNTLMGNFEIRFETDAFYYYGYINL